MSGILHQRRPLTIAERPESEMNGETRVQYVLRRYAGLDVYVPRIQAGPSAPCVTGPSPAPGTQSGAACGNNNNSESSDFSFSRDARRAGPYGNFTPLFGGRLVLGPERSLFVLSFLFLLLALVLIIVEEELIEKRCGGPIVFVVGDVLSILSLLTFFTVGITDPGVVPKNISLHELVAETAPFRARHPGQRYYRYCHKCRAFRPPRTFHCSRCEVCIRRQDIHLLTGGICVGERNRRSYFLTILFQTMLGAYLFVVNTIISIYLKQEYHSSRRFSAFETVLAVLGTTFGLVLIFMPQSGILMFIYRLYLLSVGRTAREEYRKFQYYDANDCLIEHEPLCANIYNFFFRKSHPSVFRRRLNRVDLENIFGELPTQWNLEQLLRGQRDNHDLIPNFGADEEIDTNANLMTTEQIDDAIRLREVADYARGRSTPSVPIIEQEVNHQAKRIRMPKKSKPSSIIQQQLSAFQETRRLPKATVSHHKRQKLPMTLSDGCLPRTRDGLQEMLQLARAGQLRRIIQLILLRDRNGLMEMSRRVNIAALIGMNRFDPDNLQLLELNNGLPMIAPRQREAGLGNQQRLGAGVLGIPQMVAAGLLPTARDLANSVETLVGRGRIRRLPPVGRQRYVPITMVDPPASRRWNDGGLRNFIANQTNMANLDNPQMPQVPAQPPVVQINAPVARSPPPEVVTNIATMAVAASTNDGLTEDRRSPQSLQQASRLLREQLAGLPEYENEDDNNNRVVGFPSFMVQNYQRQDPQFSFRRSNVSVAGSNLASPSQSRVAASSVPAVDRSLASHTPPMVVIPMFSDSD